MNFVFSELGDEKPSDEMVTASSLQPYVGQSDGNLYLHICSQLFENISAFDIDGEGEVSIDQFKYYFKSSEEICYLKQIYKIMNVANRKFCYLKQICKIVQQISILLSQTNLQNYIANLQSQVSDVFI